MEIDAAEVLNRVRTRRGYVMRMHEVLAENDPAFLEAYDTIFEHAVGDVSPLPVATRELLVMALDIATGATPKMVAAHAQKAIGHGATMEEVVATIEIAALVHLAKPLAYLPHIVDGLADE